MASPGERGVDSSAVHLVGQDLLSASNTLLQQEQSTLLLFTSYSLSNTLSSRCTLLHPRLFFFFCISVLLKHTFLGPYSSPNLLLHLLSHQIFHPQSLLRCSGPQALLLLHDLSLSLAASNTPRSSPPLSASDERKE